MRDNSCVHVNNRSRVIAQVTPQVKALVETKRENVEQPFRKTLFRIGFGMSFLVKRDV